jgi:hypothetical protein
MMTYCIGYAQYSKSDSIFLMTDQTIYEFQQVSELDPNKAAFLSAILPGLGQAYNNQFWKIPIIYGGGLIFGHYINYNNRIYQEMQNALIAETDQSPFTVNFYSAVYNKSALERNRDAFRRNRDFLIILTTAFYLINVADAHISAHLNEFDVNSNLSMSISPSIQSTPLNSRALGFSVSFNFK